MTSTLDTMETLLVLVLALFAVGFAVGAFLNHPDELPPHRLRRFLWSGWIGWTILCGALLHLANEKLCPPGSCIGVALGLAWFGLTLAWLVGGLCATAGIYTARNYLRNH